MVYRKKTYSRKVRFNRSKRPLSKRQVKAVSKIANKQIHKNAECKEINGLLAAAGSVNLVGGTFGPLSVTVPMPASGVLDTQFIGSEFMLKSVQLRGYVDCAAYDNNIMRVIVAQDLEDNATSLTYSDILETPNVNDALISFYKVDSNRKYKILSDQVFNWDSNNASAPKAWCCNLSYKDLKIKKVSLTATGYYGAIRVFIFGGEGGTAPAKYEFMRYRVKYYDM